MKYREYPNDPTFSHGIEWSDLVGDFSLQVYRDDPEEMLLYEAATGNEMLIGTPTALFTALDQLLTEREAAQEEEEEYISPEYIDGTDIIFVDSMGVAYADYVDSMNLIEGEVHPLKGLAYVD